MVGEGPPGETQMLSLLFLHTCCYALMYFLFIIATFKCVISPEDDASIWKLGRDLENGPKRHYVCVRGGTPRGTCRFPKANSFSFSFLHFLSLLLILRSVSQSADVRSIGVPPPTLIFSVSYQLRSEDLFRSTGTPFSPAPT